MTKIKMNKIALLIFFILSYAYLTAESGKEKKHFLWEVKSNATTVYLLGSIHMAKEDLYPLDTVIENSFARSGVLGVEININAAGEEQADLLSEFTYEDGSTMEDNLSDSAFFKIHKFLSEKGLPYELFQKIKPEFVFLTVMGIELMKNGFLPQYGIDMHFLNKAENKEIYELESFQEQLDLLSLDDSTISDEAYIDYSIKEYQNMTSQMDDMYSAWKNGDEKTLSEIVFRPVKENPELKPMMDELLDKRNFKMTENIENCLKSSKTYFIIVGAAHLIGENGIINLLSKKKSYHIKRL